MISTGTFVRCLVCVVSHKPIRLTETRTHYASPKQRQVHNLLAEFRHIVVQMLVQRVQCRRMAFLLNGHCRFTLRRNVSKPRRIAFSIFDKLSPRSSRAILESLS